jgi:hypothetical protein
MPCKVRHNIFNCRTMWCTLCSCVIESLCSTARTPIYIYSLPNTNYHHAQASAVILRLATLSSHFIVKHVTSPQFYARLIINGVRGVNFIRKRLPTILHIHISFVLLTASCVSTHVRSLHAVCLIVTTVYNWPKTWDILGMSVVN